MPMPMNLFCIIAGRLAHFETPTWQIKALPMKSKKALFSFARRKQLM